MDETINLLNHWLYRQLERESWDWLTQQRQQITSILSERLLFSTFSAVSRHVGKDDLMLLPQDRQACQTVCSDWYPGHWNIQQVARTLLVLSWPNQNQDFYLHTIGKLFATANLEELVTLYQALPILSYPEQLRLQAAEGVRSNMTAVVDAVALQNPYPAEYFDDIAWNQMILKALFVGSSLDLIQGLERRANSTLAQMLSDYAQERRSAKRSVPNQLWQLVETCPQ
ncbi:EboA domain-containing protein [Aphanothece hegewaldii]|nr:EboA domain-containing protein [Aphanothece hegewaldii]